jgi:hypothetical protein
MLVDANVVVFVVVVFMLCYNSWVHEEAFHGK